MTFVIVSFYILFAVPGDWLLFYNKGPQMLVSVQISLQILLQS